MIHTLKRFFAENLSASGDSEPSAHELHLAAAALLFEVSRSDYEIDDAERRHITESVQRHFQLSASETRELVALAEDQAEHATSLHGFTTLINDHWTLEQRIRLVESMWRVAYMDQDLNDHEVHLMRKVGRLLYIPHKQLIAAKMRARQAAG